jgi:hypothetical protein
MPNCGATRGSAVNSLPGDLKVTYHRDKNSFFFARCVDAPVANLYKEGRSGKANFEKIKE